MSHHKKTLWVLALAYFFAFFSSGLQMPLTAPAMESVGLSLTTVGAMWATRNVMGSLTPPLWGLAADLRGNVRTFAVLSFVFGAGILLLLPFTVDATFAVLLFAAYGATTGPAVGMIDGMTIQALGDQQTRFGKHRAWGTLGFSIAVLMSMVLLEEKVVRIEPGWVFFSCAGALLVTSVILFVLPPLPRPRLARIRDVLPVLWAPGIRSLFVLTVILWMSHIAFAGFLAPMVTRSHMPTWVVGASLFSSLLCETFILRGSAPLIARFGTHEILQAACVLATLRWFLSAHTTSPALFIALQSIHGFTFALFFAALIPAVMRRVPSYMHQTAQGIFSTTSFGVGGALGSLLVGIMLDHTTPKNTWLAMAAIAGVACAFVFFFVKRRA